MSRTDYWHANSLNLVSRLRQMRKLKSSIPKVPESFSEKVRFRMAFDRRRILQIYADKLGVRNYVAEKAGERYLSTITDIASVPSGIQWEKLPHNFVCKTNHGSGGMVGIWDGVELEATLPNDISGLGWTRWWVHPENFDSKKCQSMLEHWQRENYAYRSNAYPEWAYSTIERKIYIEEVLVNKDGTIASPYYFYVFNGETKVALITARNTDSSRSIGFVDKLWKQLDVGIPSINSKLIEPFPSKPSNFDEMLEVARKLSEDIEFARVDLYNVDGRIVFSEITIYPSAGQEPWVPEEFEIEMGQYWNQYVPSRKRE